MGALLTSPPWPDLPRAPRSLPPGDARVRHPAGAGKGSKQTRQALGARAGRPAHARGLAPAAAAGRAGRARAGARPRRRHAHQPRRRRGQARGGAAGGGGGEAAGAGRRGPGLGHTTGRPALHPHRRASRPPRRAHLILLPSRLTPPMRIHSRTQLPQTMPLQAKPRDEAYQAAENVLGPEALTIVRKLRTLHVSGTRGCPLWAGDWLRRCSRDRLAVTHCRTGLAGDPAISRRHLSVPSTSHLCTPHHLPVPALQRQGGEMEARLGPPTLASTPHDLSTPHPPVPAAQGRRDGGQAGGQQITQVPGHDRGPVRLAELVLVKRRDTGGAAWATGEAGQLLAPRPLPGSFSCVTPV